MKLIQVMYLFFFFIHFYLNESCISWYVAKTLSSFATVLITSKGSQITFSAVPCEEIIIREESGDCLIIGDREVETHMHMPLHPSSFFINCGLQARRVWFLETTDSCAIIHFPFQVYAHFLMICFPFANVNSAQD
ncbi:hypothetical protein IC582_010417 [Cucumis melo]